jgi:GTP-binding protein
MRINDAVFECSFPSIETCPADEVPEFAFIGRSNVGKSSLLNMLTGKDGLARVSQTPGHTRLINFFRINKKLRLVDLPGYGYAKVARENRAKFEQTVADFLALRENLQRIFVLIDSRLEPQQIDLEFLSWLQELQRPFALVFTKADKLKPSHLKANTDTFLAAMSSFCPEAPDCFFSSSKIRTGKTEILRNISELMEGK